MIQQGDNNRGSHADKDADKSLKNQRLISVVISVKSAVLSHLSLVITLCILWGFAGSVHGATFQMQTGYYVGTGISGKTVTGVGFQPEMVFIRRSTDTFAASFKTSAITAANTSFFDANGDNTATSVKLDADGFTIDSTGTAWNSLSDIYFWVAFRGSDCTSSGTFCVGSYTGNGTAGNAITSVGFQPDLVWVKKSVLTRLR